MLFLSSDFVQNQLFRKFFFEYHPAECVGPYLGPICLQRVWADGTSRHNKIEPVHEIV